jgi:4a-hydroxytetrahydrobiopterin dehydratase
MMQAPPEGWVRDGKALVREYDMGDFNGSIAFVVAVSGVANRLNHHPEIAIDWNKVTIRTWSHDKGGVTERDVALAKALDEIAHEHPLRGAG